MRTSTSHAAIRPALAVQLLVLLTLAGSPAPARAAIAKQPDSPALHAPALHVQRAPSKGPVIGGSAQPWLKMGIAADGLYTVSCAQLAAAGFSIPAGYSPTLQVFGAGSEVATDLTGAWNGGCAPADAITFYAQGIHTRYTDSNDYWLTYGVAPGKRMTQRSSRQTSAQPASFTDTRHYEQDLFYIGFIPQPFAEGTDHWFWAANILSDHPYLPAQDVTATALIQVDLTGGSYGNHDTQVFINGRLVGAAVWADLQQGVATFPFTQSLLSPVSNTVSISETSGPASVSYINSYTITYQSAFLAEHDALFFAQPKSGDYRYVVHGFDSPDILAFDISDPHNVVRLTSTSVAAQGTASYTLTLSDTFTTPARYLAVGHNGIRTPLSLLRDTPSDLHNTANGADYILITHGSLITSVQPLAALRASQGMRVKVIDVQDIYDEFNSGLIDPQAMRDFFYYAYQNWQRPAPAYVVLVGSATYDYKNVLGGVKPNLVPTFMRNIDPYIGETATDNYFVSFDPATSLPSMAIGRLPVTNAAQADAVVAKLIGYERNPAAGAWRSHITFVSDTAYNSTGTPDGAGNFWAISDQVAGVPAPFAADRIYYNSCPPSLYPFCQLPYPPYSTPASTRNAITTAVQSGSLILNYVGHSAFTFWGNDQIFRAGDLAGLGNTTRLPLFLSMTCLDGFFQHPFFTSLAEVNVDLPDGGALASWSASGQGVAEGHDYLNSGFFDQVMNHGQYRIGLAAQEAKRNLWDNAHGNYRDLVETFNLLGDPASRLSLGLLLSTSVRIRDAQPAGTPQVVLATAAITNLGPFDTDGVVVSYTLPASVSDVQLIGASLPVTPIATATGLAFTVGHLAAGAGGSITVTARLSSQPSNVDARALTVTTTATTLAPHPDSVVLVTRAQAQHVYYLPVFFR